MARGAMRIPMRRSRENEWEGLKILYIAAITLWQTGDR